MSLLARRRLPFQAPIVATTSSEDALDSKYVDVLHIELPARNLVLEKMECKDRFELHDQTKTPGTPGQAGPMFSVGSNEPSGAFFTSRERESRCETSAFKKFAVPMPHEKQGVPKYSGIQLDSQLDSLMTPGSPARPGPLLKRDRILSHHMRKAGAHDLEGGRGS